MPYIQPSILLLFQSFFLFCFIFNFYFFSVLFNLICLYGCNSLLFALLTGFLYISVTLLIFVTSVVSYKLFSGLLFFCNQLIQQM